ncbi:MAG: bifunctional oligoribonuclease/PAP phosphatase NrnA [Spirochaetales bacterium]|nr:bifunctional oligoribonuclease/PAP phosphatase NrnA [Spirochaetales bacterium]
MAERIDTKRNEDIKNAILEKIREYDKIVIARHERPDGDAIGSSHGLAEILRLSFPNKQILVANQDSSEYLSFLETTETDPNEVDYSDALAIVTDTANIERCANKRITEARELIKIDHHIDVSPLGNISWVEDDRSSVCEMIAAFQYTFRDVLKCNLKAATLLYTGMVTDSGRFKYVETKGDTLRLAGYLLDMGVDTQTLHANLELESFEFFKFKAYIYERMKITENGVAYLYVDKAMQKRFNLSREQASNSVDFMNKIRGSLIWLAFIDNDDGSIRVRLRSRFVTVDKLANKYSGGGHANASGATVYSTQEMDSLIKDADELLGNYKRSNGGWL